MRYILKPYFPFCQALNRMSTGRILMDPLINIIILSTVPSKVWESVLLLPNNVETIIGPWEKCSRPVARQPNKIEKVQK